MAGRPGQLLLTAMAACILLDKGATLCAGPSKRSLAGFATLAVGSAMRYSQAMREIVFWRWIFGLAVVLAYLLAWSGTTVRPDEGFLSLPLNLYPV